MGRRIFLVFFFSVFLVLFFFVVPWSRGLLVPRSAGPLVFLRKRLHPLRKFHRIWSMSLGFSKKSSIPCVFS